MLHRAVWKILTDVSEKLSASIITAMELKNRPDDGGTKLL
jgi:hypothetical protein